MRPATCTTAGELDYRGIQAILNASFTALIHGYLKPEAPYPGTFPTSIRPDEEMGRERRLDYVLCRRRWSKAS